MNTHSVKLELVNWLINLKDKSLISTIMSIKKSSEDGDWYNQLTNQQKIDIEEGLKDIENENTMSSEEFWKKYEKYL